MFASILTDLSNMGLHRAFHFLWALYASVVGSGRRTVIIDTDLFSDVDDVGSLAVANVLHKCGVVDMAGVAINTPSKYGALAASVVNTHFGNPHVPIAALRPLTDDTFFDEWAFL